jgi:hypothetical protein
VECPFCAETISDQALVCPHCARDVSFVVLRGLAGRLAAAEARLDAQEAALTALAALVEASPGPREPAAAPVWRTLPWLALLTLLLLAAHALIVGVFDLDTRVLRVVSILLPLPFGLRRPEPVWATGLAALAVAGLSVGGMLVTTSLLDGVPVLPQGWRDWAETGQYVASIALAYLVGCLAARRWGRRRGAGRAAQELAALLVRTGAPAQREPVAAAQHIQAVAAWINTVTMVITAIGAIITALGHFFS